MAAALEASTMLLSMLLVCSKDFRSPLGLYHLTRRRVSESELPLIASVRACGRGILEAYPAAAWRDW